MVIRNEGRKAKAFWGIVRRLPIEWISLDFEELRFENIDLDVGSGGHWYFIREGEGRIDVLPYVLGNDGTLGDGVKSGCVHALECKTNGVFVYGIH